MIAKIINIETKAIDYRAGKSIDLIKCDYFKQNPELNQQNIVFETFVDGYTVLEAKAEIQTMESIYGAINLYGIDQSGTPHKLTGLSIYPK